MALLMMPPKLRAWAERSPVLRRLSFLPTTRFLRVRAAVDDLLYEEVAQRRLSADQEATDLLSRLLAARDENGQPMCDQELRDELITLLEAGHETTATGLAWAFERLLRNTGMLSHLQDELAARSPSPSGSRLAPTASASRSLLASLAPVSVVMSLVGLELGARIGMRAGQRGELLGGRDLIGVGVAVGIGVI